MWPCTELVSPASCIPRRFPTTGWCRGGGSATLPAVGASPPSSAQPARQSPGCCCNLNQPHRALLAAPSLWEPLARLPLNTLTPGLGAKTGLATHTGGSTWRCGLGGREVVALQRIQWCTHSNFIWRAWFCKTNRKVRLSGGQLIGVDKKKPSFSFLEIRNMCLLVVRMDLYINSLMPKHYHIWGGGKDDNRWNLLYVCMRKNQIEKYRYVAKEMLFHNVLPWQTILPLHNFTSCMTIFLLQMINSDQSNAVGIWRKPNVLTVWQTRHYVYRHRQIKTAHGKRQTLNQGLHCLLY